MPRSESPENMPNEAFLVAAKRLLEGPDTQDKTLLQHLLAKYVDEGTYATTGVDDPIADPAKIPAGAAVVTDSVETTGAKLDEVMSDDSGRVRKDSSNKETVNEDPNLNLIDELIEYIDGQDAFIVRNAIVRQLKQTRSALLENKKYDVEANLRNAVGTFLGNACQSGELVELDEFGYRHFYARLTELLYNLTGISVIYPDPGTSYDDTIFEQENVDKYSGLPEGQVVRVHAEGYRRGSEVLAKARIIISD